MQSPIFVVGSVIEDALEKNQELWLVLQDMRKAYDSVGWKHLKRSLVKIKMCEKFIRFFGSIHNSHVNKVITDFGLTDRYCVHDGLDQEEVFFSLLQCIFYDSLLCEVKRQDSVYGYRLNSHFISKTGWADPQAELSSFLAASAFVDDTIWVGSSQAATQCILDVASEFFRFNDISVNNDKTVAISINCRVSDSHLTISSVPIFIAKKRESHHYLSIFLFSEGLSKPSLAKAQADVWFFVNLVLRKAVSDKQYGYVVSDICFFCDFGVVCDILLTVNAVRLSVYMDGSLSGLGTINMKTDAAIFFEDINLGLGVGVSGLVSSTIMKLQAITLALECISFSYSIDLFSNSQAALDACESESSLIRLDFRNCYWIKRHHIATIIHQKNLDVNWVKVKGHSGVLDNEHTDALAKDTALSAWCLPYLVSKHFLYAGGMTVSVNQVRWEVGVGSCIVADSLRADINWFKSSLVWHTDFHLASSFTSIRMASCHTYFMKALHHRLPVADAAGHARLLDAHVSAWEALSGLSCSSLWVL
ncbi:hypothetical protein G9A89_023736 [Geosiphon pyriformis]|nr:hypothetical protein G9A89_023736 [Geosiphon pyriformis]